MPGRRIEEGKMPKKLLDKEFYDILTNIKNKFRKVLIKRFQTHTPQPVRVFFFRGGLNLKFYEHFLSIPVLHRFFGEPSENNQA